MSQEPLRIDVLLHRLCLTKSRSEAKSACDAGAILIEGRAVRASHLAGPGERITIRFAQRLLEVQVLELPPKSVSRKGARELYEVVRDERLSRSL